MNTTFQIMGYKAKLTVEVNGREVDATSALRFRSSGVGPPCYVEIDALLAAVSDKQRCCCCCHLCRERAA